MIQHPIPQNVTGYQFHLIGDMTIKQFILLSIGIAGAIFFYYTNLFSPIKWIFVLTCGVGGFALAFLPFEERPLDQWIVNYIRAIYRPTQFIWRKQNPAPDYFSFVANKDTMLPQDLEEISRQAATRREQGLRSFLVTLPQETANQETWEQSYVDQISTLFNTAQSPSNPITPSAPTAVASTLNITNLNTAQPTSPPADDNLEPPTASRKPLHDTNVSSGVIQLEKIKIGKKEETTPTTLPQQTAQPNSSNDTQSTSFVTEVIDLNTIVAPTTTPDLPFPSAPTTPNTIVGMVLTKDGKIAEGAIVEVLDESNLPVRATKTNQLGQFFSTTPLKRGIYHITVEKPGLTFDTIELNIVGNIVPPLKIQAKA